MIFLTKFATICLSSNLKIKTIYDKFKTKHGTMDSKVFWNNDLNMLTVMPPECGPTTPRTVIPVVDVSLSMDSTASIRDSNKNKVETEYTVLDLVKYSLKVVVKSLDEGDTFGLITFSNNAEIVIEPIKKTSDNEEYLMETIDDISTIGMTNLWAGLKEGIKLANNYGNVSIMLFTDGMPNSHPALGYKDAFNRHPIMFDDVSVHVFTYGYSDMDTDLMFDISRQYNGTFNYISDPSVIGTVFVNTMANIMSLACREIKCPALNASFGQLNYGQPRHFILAENPREVFIFNTPVQVEEVPHDFGSDQYHFHVARRQLGEILNGLFIKRKTIDDTKKSLKAVSWDLSPTIKEDVEGEITKALETDAYDKWGKYYLRSIFSCHEREWRNNFFDKSIQGYGCGMTFKEHARRLEEIFEKLPVQKPTGKKRRNDYQYGASLISACGSGSACSTSYNMPVARALSVTNMRDTFLNASAGCIGGDSTVILNNGTFKKVKSLVAGDILSGGNAVVNVVQGPPVQMFKYNGFWITPYHPVTDKNNEWKFPIDEVRSPKFAMKASSWNLVIQSGHFYVLGHDMEQATKVIALGHGIKDDIVASHPYLGSDKVKEDVQKGYNPITKQCHIRGFKRDPNTGLLCGTFLEHDKPLVTSN